MNVRNFLHYYLKNRDIIFKYCVGTKICRVGSDSGSILIPFLLDMRQFSTLVRVGAKETDTRLESVENVFNNSSTDFYGRKF